MKEIQEWLGHSDYSATANIYAHLDSSAKEKQPAAMAERIDFSLVPGGKHSRDTQENLGENSA